MAAAAAAATAPAVMASIARRSTFLRFSCRPDAIPSLRRPRRLSLAPSPPSVRREALVLSSMLPLHSATASACLVSKLPSDLSSSIEGRFANYLSPI